MCARLHNAVGYRPLQPIRCSYPFELVSLDTAEITLPSGAKGYLLVAIDHFTRWIECKWVNAQTTKAVEQFIKEYIIYRHGCPQRIQSDGGSVYVAKAILGFYESYNIKPTVTAAYHPESNGMV